MFLAAGDFEVVGVGFLTFTQDDVDGARNGPGPSFGRGGTQNLDFFDLLRGECVDGKTWRHALSVEQDLGVTTAQAPHPNGAASTGRTLHRDTRQALEHLAQSGVALFFDLFATNDDFGGRRLTAHLGVVVAVAADLNLAQIGRGRWRGTGRRGGRALSPSPIRQSKQNYSSEQQAVGQGMEGEMGGK